MHKMLAIALFAPILAVASTNVNNDDLFIRADIKHNINHRLLKSIGETESGNKNFVISFVLSEAPALTYTVDNILPHVRFKYSKYKRGWIFTLYPDNKTQALNVLRLVKVAAKNSSYDLGLMQVNSQNAKERGWSEELLLTDPEYNIDKGAELLSGCKKIFYPSVNKTIECYNKGYGTSRFDYKYTSKVLSAFYDKEVNMQVKSQTRQTRYSSNHALYLPWNIQ